MKEKAAELGQEWQELKDNEPNAAAELGQRANCARDLYKQQQKEEQQAAQAQRAANIADPPAPPQDKSKAADWSPLRLGSVVWPLSMEVMAAEWDAFEATCVNCNSNNDFDYILRPDATLHDANPCT